MFHTVNIVIHYIYLHHHRCHLTRDLSEYRQDSGRPCLRQRHSRRPTSTTRRDDLYALTYVHALHCCHRRLFLRTQLQCKYKYNGRRMFQTTERPTRLHQKYKKTAAN